MGLTCSRRAVLNGIIDSSLPERVFTTGAASSGNRAMTDPERKRYMCECHVTHNFFVHGLGLHLEYTGDDDAFVERYGEKLCAEGAVLKDVLADVRQQREERLQAPAESAARASCCERLYERIRPQVYVLDPSSFLTSGFCDVVAALARSSHASVCTRQARVRELQSQGLLTEVGPELFTLKVFTPAFCKLLEEELSNFSASGLPKSAPNTMNRHGVILSELGFGPGFLDPFVSDYIDVLASSLLPEHTKGLDSYRAFTVLYEAAEGGDCALSSHYDNAEVTLNVNLGGEWAGGTIAFEGLVTKEPDDGDHAEIKLKQGEGLLHAGLNLHKALPITSGRRHNLIVWCRSSKARNSRCPMCFQPPRVVETNKFGDEGFTVPPCRLSDNTWDSHLQELFS